MARQRLSSTLTIHGAVNASVGRAVRAVGGAFLGVSDRIAEARRQQEALGRAMSQWSRRGAQGVDEIRREYRRLGDEIRRVRLEQNTAALGANATALGAESSRRGQIGGQLMGAAAAAAAVAAPVAVYARFEQQMSRVGAISRASAEDLGRLSAQALELGATTRFSATEAAQGMEYLAMAGFSVEEAMAAMPGMLDLAAAAGADLGRTADVASNMLSAFGLEATQMGRVGDVLVSTFTQSNTTLDSLADTMRYVAPVASSLGASIEDVAAMAGVLGDAGIQSTQAGTAMRAMLTRLAAPTGRAVGAIERLGIETADASGNLRPITDIFVDMQRAMEGMGSAARTEIMAAVFGQEALSAATILLDQAGTGALQSFTAAVHEQGAASRVAAQQSDNLVGELTSLKSAAEGLMIELGSALAPAIRVVFEAMTAAARAVTQWTRDNPELTRTIALVTAGLVALRVATLAASYAMSLMRSAVLLGQRALLLARRALLLTAGAFRALTLAMMSNPWIAIATAAVAAGILIWRNWDEVSGALGRAWEWVRDTAIRAWDGLRSAVLQLWDQIVAGIRVGWEFIQRWFGWMPHVYILANWRPIIGVVTSIFGRVRDVVAGVLDWITQRIAAVGNAARGLISLIPGVDVRTDEQRENRSQRRAARRERRRGGMVEGIDPAGGSSVVNNTQAAVTVNAAPGQSEERIAQEVVRIIEGSGPTAGRTGGLLYDGV